ncbi:hypothetical protein I3843_04G075300 [Carya illinoinensis]|uniref:Uncharacterized protein n=1 Tax=Carya illinoinensis TaxID=32201 RepID=A0A8T1QTH7_CARIL|nr:uncharacterized protein LOC122307428 [Carya illinoinensis]KAG6657311.1 hypothetical protein CIPAW_04G081400 [Carya illinoinensis]KAG7982879.1 hypothetical protein I3843_04G075300 [Carya illinoinensis]
MLDHQLRFTGKPLYSVSPTHQIHSSHDSAGDTEFDFWLGSTDMEIQAQTSLVEEGFEAYSPALWERIASRNIDYESSPLLPHNHHSSKLSSTSRKKAIAEGRRQLMEMVQDMPESCFELSLKDILDEQHISGVQEVIIEKSGFHLDTEPQMKRQNKKKNKGITKASRVSTIRSMDNKTFLLNMFFPTSLALKMKSKAGNCSEVSPSPSFEDSKHHIYKDWWMKRFLQGASNKRNIGNSMGGSTRSSNSRLDDAKIIPGCWSFHTKKNKTKRRRGCIF